LLTAILSSPFTFTFTAKQCCLCRVRRSELSRPHRPRQVRSASECVRRSHCAARHTQTRTRHSASAWRSSRLSSHRHTRHDKTVPSVSCLACPSVCACVCVCLSQVGVLLKRLNIGSHKACRLWRCELALRCGCAKVS